MSYFLPLLVFCTSKGKIHQQCQNERKKNLILFGLLLKIPTKATKDEKETTKEVVSGTFGVWKTPLVLSLSIKVLFISLWEQNVRKNHFSFHCEHSQRKKKCSHSQYKYSQRESKHSQRDKKCSQRESKSSKLKKVLIKRMWALAKS